MKTTLRSLVAIAALSSAFLAGCSQEVSHTESDKPGWFGGSTHKETTTYRNPDGSISTEHQEETHKP